MSGNRLQRHFEAARQAGRRSLIVYLCGGDPDLASTERLVPALATAGADVIEIGVPFSDPLADGPTIQAASQRALAAGTTLAGLLDLVARLRRGGCEVPLVLMGYLNPIVRMGVGAFVDRAVGGATGAGDLGHQRAAHHHRVGMRGEGAGLCGLGNAEAHGHRCTGGSPHPVQLRGELGWQGGADPGHPGDAHVVEEAPRPLADCPEPFRWRGGRGEQHQR